MSACISLLIFMHKFFIFKYAVEIATGSIKPSELFDTNSSVSPMCARHLFVAAVYRTLRKNGHLVSIYNINNSENNVNFIWYEEDIQYSSPIEMLHVGFTFMQGGEVFKNYIKNECALI